jgi:hypothetical protein
VERTHHHPGDPNLPRAAAGRARLRFALVGGMGLILSAVGYSRDAAQFFHSWLVAFVFVLTIALGALFFVMVQHLSRAGWSVVVRRITEAAGSTLPLFVLLFVPVALGIPELFHWSHADAVEHDALLRHKQAFLNVPFFLVRAAVYFLVWIALGLYFFRRSVAQDKSRDPAVTVTLQRRAAPGMILFAVTLTLMAFDWVMSLDPHWYSTIFGVYIFAGAAAAMYSFVTLSTAALRRAGYMQRLVRVDHFQDLGRWIFALSVFWAYIAFSQFMLIWYGNIPEETVFFVRRAHGSWVTASIVLGVGHFLVPFALLMSRWTKRRPGIVTALAAWVLLMHYVDLHWLVMPNLHPEGFSFHWLDATTLLATGGLFLAAFAHQLGGKAVIPLGDPRLPESLAVEHLY